MTMTTESQRSSVVDLLDTILSLTGISETTRARAWVLRTGLQKDSVH